MNHTARSRPTNRNRKATPRRRHCQLWLEPLEDRCLLSADPVLEWNQIALNALQYDSTLGANAQQNAPTKASRALAIVSAAVYDSVNSIDGSYEPYLIQVNAPKDASMTAAVAQAAHDTLVSLFPAYQPVLDADLAADLASVPDVQARNDGAQVGHTVAAAILAARSNDGSDVAMPYTPGNQPGQWRPDPLHPNQTAVGSLWGNVTPFALNSAEQFHAPPPPNITSEAYADAYMEVKNYGGDGVTTPTLRTPEQTQIAIFWAYDGSPGLGTPLVHYNQIAETLAVQQNNSVVDNARFFALINIAMADAGITAWDSKYDYNFWRPVTAIRENDPGTGPTGLGSGNQYLYNPACGIDEGDPNWTPLGAPADNGSGTNGTPAFPSCVSGHSTFGGALFQMMTDFFGTDNIHFTIGSDEFNGVTKDQNGNVRPVVFRSYDSFSQAMEENGQSRIYLGVHWQFDNQHGIALGTDVANYVFKHLLNPSKGEDNNQAGASVAPAAASTLTAANSSGATVASSSSAAPAVSVASSVDTTQTATTATIATALSDSTGSGTAAKPQASAPAEQAPGTGSTSSVSNQSTAVFMVKAARASRSTHPLSGAAWDDQTVSG